MSALHLAELQRGQEDLQSCLKTLSDVHQGISHALQRLREIEGEAASPSTSTAFSRQVSQQSNFFLSGLVPMARPRIEKRADEVTKGVNILDEWKETFVLSEEDAIEQYNEMYEVARKNGQHRSREHFQLELQREARESSHVWSWLPVLLQAWQFFVAAIVLLDLWSIPLMVAWPSYATGFLEVYAQYRFVFWILDILHSLIPGLLDVMKLRQITTLIRYARLRMLVDVALVYVDIWSSSQLRGVQRLVTFLLLGRIFKVQKALIGIENYFAARGNIKVVMYLTIFRCVIQILIVNHILACFLFWLGTWGMESGMPNWIERYQVFDNDRGHQYITSFNWVIAQYTPAPFPNSAQNFWEQCLVVCIILTCLPLLGSEIAKVSGTVNVLNEKSRERDTLRRDLQRWLRKTQAPEMLGSRILASLQDVIISKDSPLEIKEPMALKFLPSTLLEELRIVRMTEKLSSHEMFTLLMHDSLGISGALSSCFEVMHVVQGDAAFESSRRAEALFITQSGEFHLHLPRKTGRGDAKQTMQVVSALLQGHEQELPLAGVGDMVLASQQWLAEACLYASLPHSCSVTALSYSKLLRCSVGHFVATVQKSPAAAVAIHEYATHVVRCLSKNQGEVWEVLGGKLIEEGVQHTQLSDLLVPGTGRIHRFKSNQQTDFSTFAETLLARKSNQERVETLKAYIPELQEDALYAKLGLGDELQRALLSMLAAIWFLTGDYNSMVECQKPLARLREGTFYEIKGLLMLDEMNHDQLIVALVILAIRGLSKTEDLARLCPPSERRSPEQVLHFAVNKLDTYLPSVASMMNQLYDLMVSTIRMLGQYNFAQFLQGENNPHAISKLQESLKFEGPETYQVFKLVQVCILCGVTGHVRLDGSMFLTELNGCSMLKGLAALQDVAVKDPCSIYWNFIAARAAALHLRVDQASHLVLARLACLTRTTDAQGLRLIAQSWEQLNSMEQELLQEIFLLDGLKNKTVMFLYLPLFLTNAVANKELGLCSGLQFLVELYIKLLKHRCLHRSETTVRVDIAAIAAVAQQVDEVRLLRQCLEHCRIVKHAHGITVLLTAKSYQILSGQVVQEARSMEMMESLLAQGSRLENVLAPQVVEPFTLREGIASHEF